MPRFIATSRSVGTETLPPGSLTRGYSAGLVTGLTHRGGAVTADAVERRLGLARDEDVGVAAQGREPGHRGPGGGADASEGARRLGADGLVLVGERLDESAERGLGSRGRLGASARAASRRTATSRAAERVAERRPPRPPRPRQEPERLRGLGPHQRVRVAQRLRQGGHGRARPPGRSGRAPRPRAGARRRCDPRGP